MVYITRNTMHEPAFLQLKERKAKAVQAQLQPYGLLGGRCCLLTADRFGNSTEYRF